MGEMYAKHRKIPGELAKVDPPPSDPLGPLIFLWLPQTH